MADRELAEVLAWEDLPAELHSPGPVLSHERLLRALNQPTHWDRQKKTFTPTAFDEACSFGLSVNRLDHASVEHVALLARQRVNAFNESLAAEKPIRSFIGFVEYNASIVRAQTSVPDAQGSVFRILALFDTAYEDDASHADIFVIRKGVCRRRARDLLRELGLSNLRNILGNSVSCEQMGYELQAAGLI